MAISVKGRVVGTSEEIMHRRVVEGGAVVVAGTEYENIAAYYSICMHTNHSSYVM